MNPITRMCLRTALRRCGNGPFVKYAGPSVKAAPRGGTSMGRLPALDEMGWAKELLEGGAVRYSPPAVKKPSTLKSLSELHRANPLDELPATGKTRYEPDWTAHGLGAGSSIAPSTTSGVRTGDVPRGEAPASLPPDLSQELRNTGSRGDLGPEVGLTPGQQALWDKARGKKPTSSSTPVAATGAPLQAQPPWQPYQETPAEKQMRAQVAPAAPTPPVLDVPTGPGAVVRVGKNKVKRFRGAAVPPAAQPAPTQRTPPPGNTPPATGPRPAVRTPTPDEQARALWASITNPTSPSSLAPAQPAPVSAAVSQPSVPPVSAEAAVPPGLTEAERMRLREAREVLQQGARARPSTLAAGRDFPVKRRGNAQAAVQYPRAVVPPEAPTTTGVAKPTATVTTGKPTTTADKPSSPGKPPSDLSWLLPSLSAAGGAGAYGLYQNSQPEKEAAYRALRSLLKAAVDPWAVSTDGTESSAQPLDDTGAQAHGRPQAQAASSSSFAAGARGYALAPSTTAAQGSAPGAAAMAAPPAKLASFFRKAG